MNKRCFICVLSAALAIASAAAARAQTAQAVLGSIVRTVYGSGTVQPVDAEEATTYEEAAGFYDWFLADMLAMIEKGEISTTAGKTVLEEIIFSEKTATQVVEEKGLRQMNDTGALEQVVKDILAANPKVVEDYRGGKTNALGFLVGQCMRASKGKGNPNILREMLEKALNG